ncbi:hypothetical protein Ait01nite_068100 [Actinoplanes italicus]|uniref:Uncharacterized protein n=1 Tax=Actinoplanes italicus TaxID=113567 RepID=A0A2T0K189_9ACTN|nr:hypothetical protein [Actinoplanes italicus]PRX16558.1 hypothetical protein CLV67_119139 [Actinoplanes italicus]GIE33765.1 hypothetical protein Ait01nite_068100 [Actinoplanes italicus]
MPTPVDVPSTATVVAERMTALETASGHAVDPVFVRDHGRDWVLFRTVDYWLWGLGAGLTEDPVRCHRLAGIFADG